MMHRHLKILVVEPSAIIRSGLAAVFKRLSKFQVQVSENASFELTEGFLNTQKPDLLIINPVYWGVPDLRKLRSDPGCTDLKCMALISTVVSEYLLSQYDDIINLHDSQESIGAKIEKIFESPPTRDNRDSGELLSAREKEVLVCVVKGMTNKETGKELFLSTHTVISHRRNISRKLEIHSTAGLTVFAIVNKLVALDDVRNL